MNVNTPIIQGVVPHGSEIANIVIIAGKGTSTPIRHAADLEAKYSKPADSWQKKTGMVKGSKFRYEIHWYASDGMALGYEYKLKGVRDK